MNKFTELEDYPAAVPGACPYFAPPPSEDSMGIPHYDDSNEDDESNDGEGKPRMINLELLVMPTSSDQEHPALEHAVMSESPVAASLVARTGPSRRKRQSMPPDERGRAKRANTGTVGRSQQCESDAAAGVQRPNHQLNAHDPIGHATMPTSFARDVCPPESSAVELEAREEDIQVLLSHNWLPQTITGLSGLVLGRES
jgi:hypothetical protein